MPDTLTDRTFLRLYATLNEDQKLLLEWLYYLPGPEVAPTLPTGNQIDQAAEIEDLKEQTAELNLRLVNEAANARHHLESQLSELVKDLDGFPPFVDHPDCFIAVIRTMVQDLELANRQYLELSNAIGVDPFDELSYHESALREAKTLNEARGLLFAVCRLFGTNITAVLKDSAGFLVQIEAIQTALADRDSLVQERDRALHKLGLLQASLEDCPAAPTAALEPAPVVAVGPAAEEKSAEQLDKRSIDSLADRLDWSEPRMATAQKMIRDGAKHKAILRSTGYSYSQINAIRTRMGVPAAPVPPDKPPTLEERIETLVGGKSPINSEWVIDIADFVRAMTSVSNGASYLDLGVMRDGEALKGLHAAVMPFAGAYSSLATPMDRQEFKRLLGIKLREVAR